MGIKYTGGAADIYKCFDQVRRDLVYKLLKVTGMPKRLIHAYKTFQESVMVRNTVAGGFGEPYFKPHLYPSRGPAIHGYYVVVFYEHG